MKAILKNISLLGLFLLTTFPGPSLWFGKRPEDRVLSILHQEADRLDQETREEVASLVQELACAYRLDPMLILAVMKVESTFNPQAVSRARAYGLMQVRSIAVREVADDLGLNPQDSRRLFENDFNLRVGVHYLSFLLQKFDGDLNKALMAYNAGPTAVTRLYKRRPAPKGGYQGKVLKIYQSFANNKMI